MDDLKTLVHQLIAVDECGEIGKAERIKIIQEINTKLLTEYYIEVPGIRIYPLRVEAYYFHPGKFEDSTVHGDPQQRKFNRLYRHNKKKRINLENDNGGVDLCLSLYDEEDENASYFLSFLIKNSRVETNDFKKDCKQIELNKILNELGIENIESLDVLEERKHQIEGDTKVFHTVRVGLNGKPFGREPLASLIDINRRNEEDVSKLFFDFAPAAGKEQIIAEYLREHPEENTVDNRKKWYGGKGGDTKWMKDTKKLKELLK